MNDYVERACKLNKWLLWVDEVGWMEDNIY